MHGGALEEGRQTYPAYLLLLTSFIGLTLTSKALEGGLLARPSAGLSASVYIAKLSLLVLPQVNVHLPAGLVLHLLVCV